MHIYLFGVAAQGEEHRQEDERNKDEAGEDAKNGHKDGVHFQLARVNDGGGEGALAVGLAIKNPLKKKTQKNN